MVEDWDQLQSLLDDLTAVRNGWRPAYLFRGQSNSAWSLFPSLARFAAAGADDAYAFRYEELGVSKFLAEGHAHISPQLLRRSDVELWGLMQHHFAPTRLLDWSASPHVAAYFATESGSSPTDGALWLFRADLLSKAAREVYLDDEGKPYGDEWDCRKLLKDPVLAQRRFAPRSSSPSGARWTGIAWPPSRGVSQRADVRSEITLRSSANSSSISGGGRGAKREPHTNLKIVIPVECKPQILGRLRAMNISANALFSGPRWDRTLGRGDAATR